MMSKREKVTELSDAEVRARLAEWLRPMREASPAPSDDAAMQANRSATVESIAAAIRRAPAVAKRRRLGQTLWWAAAAVAVLGVGGAGYAINQSPTNEVAQERANLRQVVGKVVVTLPNGSDRLVTPDTQLSTGEEVSTTAQAFASLELEDQARVDLSSATTVKLERVEQRDHGFYLRSGRVDVNVPKVAGEPRRLTVRTADTLVSVRGTIFSVEVAEQDQRRVTLVRVSRGAVSVTSGGKEVMVLSGQRWSSLKAAEVSEPHTGDVQRSFLDHEEAAGTVPVPLPNAGAAKASAASSLARQNQLFENGLRARDQGDDKKAQYWFERLLSEYPNSPLRPSAKSQRDKAKRRLLK